MHKKVARKDQALPSKSVKLKLSEKGENEKNNAVSFSS